MPWNEQPQGEIRRITRRPSEEITDSEYIIDIEPIGYELFKAISAEIWNMLPLSNAQEALEDALDEMKKIHKYYLNKSLNAVLQITSPQKNIHLVNRMDVVSAPKQIPYDSSE